MRSKLLVANLKNRLNTEETLELCRRASELVSNQKEILEHVALAIAPSSMCLTSAKEAIGNTGIELAVQNIPAYPAWLLEETVCKIEAIGTRYSILWHSELSNYGNEGANEILRCVLSKTNNLDPMICVGERERMDEATRSRIISGQITAIMELDGITSAGALSDRISFAYEPRWAISGQAPDRLLSPEEVSGVAGLVRDSIAKMYGDKFANKIKVLYGGSLDSKNIAEYIYQEGIDGGLVGSASTNFEELARILREACRLSRVS